MFSYDTNASCSARLFGIFGILFILVAFTPDEDVIVRFKFGKGPLPYDWADEVIFGMRKDWVEKQPIVGLEAAKTRFINSVEIAMDLAEKGEISYVRARGHKAEVEQICMLIDEHMLRFAEDCCSFYAV